MDETINFNNKSWEIKNLIAKGGFGTVYKLCEKNDNNNCYAIKIEPSDNGPLFVEMHFYKKINKNEIKNFIDAKNLSYLGIPLLYHNGIIKKDNIEYRYIVIDYYEFNLNDILKKYIKLPIITIYKITIQILYILEYLHKKKYTHNDIKKNNIMFNSSLTKVYLIDYGLIYNMNSNQEYNIKCSNDGTLEYLPLITHLFGLKTYMGDIESLMYNIIEWYSGSLPWIKYKKKNVILKKLDFFNTCLTNSPIEICKLYNYIKNAPSIYNYNFIPDHDKLINYFVTYLKSKNINLNDKLVFCK
ncbi:putative ser/thr protein kinase [Betaentomopoxvirus amoorei]|uniref:non-specific serine/threonine protein kinase n=1 Tax=Amsacta moorei entomopoxvirus TaxID=28321 RepID=Q9EMK9_AMEPV|nr:putative ser/thr protein kinase [Amsacta moorei entomopoxvirus]AAG02903.1 AMV197 [Amsacta moorei entomopoxvirus]